MGDHTGISWTDATWNPTRGCSRVSEGCRHCYAETQALRITRFSRGRKIPLGDGPYDGLVKEVGGEARWTGIVRLEPKTFDQPLRWKRPRRIFVNSMSDLHHEVLPFEDILAVYGVMAMAWWHTYQVLTKRPERRLEFMREVAKMTDPVGRAVEAARARGLTIGHGQARGVWPLDNVLEGVSIEDQKTANERVPILLETDAWKRFVSYEPALGYADLEQWLAPCPGDMDYAAHSGACCNEHARLDWVIVGGESGTGARPFNVWWAMEVVRLCKEYGVAAFVKQLGEKPYIQVPPTRGRLPVIVTGKGDDPAQWEPGLRVQQFPEAA